MTNLNGWIQKDACCKAFSPDCQSISELYSRQSIFGCIDIQNGFIFNAFVVQKSLDLPCSRRKMLELGRRNGQQKIESYAQTYLLQLNQCCWGQRKSCATPIICQRPLNHGKQRDLLRYLSCECTERNRSHQLTLEVPWTWHIYCKSMRCYLLPAWKVEQLMRRCTDFRTGGGYLTSPYRWNTMTIIKMASLLLFTGYYIACFQRRISLFVFNSVNVVLRCSL